MRERSRNHSLTRSVVECTVNNFRGFVQTNFGVDKFTKDQGTGGVFTLIGDTTNGVETKRGDGRVTRTLIRSGLYRDRRKVAITEE